jgi:hypothetical protein
LYTRGKILHVIYLESRVVFLLLSIILDGFLG